jgi:hypothetical protein
MLGQFRVIKFWLVKKACLNININTYLVKKIFPRHSALAAGCRGGGIAAMVAEAWGYLVLWHTLT